MRPRPSMLMPAEAYALWASSYPARAHNPVMRAEERAMLALMPDTLHGAAVLDVGCGSGRYMLHALRRGAARVIGVDLSAPMLARADAELAALQAAADVDLIQGSLAALPVPDARANLTLCGLVVGHLDDLQRALAELCRVTRPGGTLLYSHWHAACAALGLRIEQVLEPMLDPADIPATARFDRAALEVPVALVFRLRRPV